MIDKVRQIVSGPKNRYKSQAYNLDLTYITPRIIAMAFPASGIEKLVRNSIDEVCKMLKENHNNQYITVNLSNRNVDEEKLMNVYSYEWQDHKIVTLDLMFKICRQIFEFLDKNEQRIAAIHCNHGKGRTGTIISCYLLYSGYFKQASQAMKFYQKRRFIAKGYGVTQPCQVKYIEYFAQIMKNPLLLRPKIVYVKKIIMSGECKLNNPYFKLINVTTNNKVFSTKGNKKILQVQSQKKYTWKFNEVYPICGDFVVQIKNQKIGKNLAATYNFNTNFIPQQNFISIGLKQLSPHAVEQSGDFDVNYKIEIIFVDNCECSEKDANLLCKKCKQFTVYEEPKIAQIAKALKKAKQIVNPGKMLFGSQQKLFLKLMEQKQI